MKQKYLLPIITIIIITIIIVILITIYYHGSCNIFFCSTVKMNTGHDKFIKEMEYVSSQVGFDVTTRDLLGTVYNDHDGDLEQIVEHMKQKKVLWDNSKYIAEVVGINDYIIIDTLKNNRGDVGKTIEIINELKKTGSLLTQKINYVVDVTNSNYDLADAALSMTDRDIDKAISLVNQALNATNGEIIEAKRIIEQYTND